MLDLNLELEKALKSYHKIYEFAIHHLGKVPSEHRAKVLKLLEEGLTKSNNAYLTLAYVYYFAKNIEGANIKALEEVVIKSGDADYAYLFALGIKEANINALEDVVIKSGNAGYAYLFAKDIKGASKKLLEEVVIKSGDAEYAYYFARDVEGADKKALEEVIINSGDPYYALYFALDIEGANKKKLEPIIEKDNTHWDMYNRHQALKSKGSNIKFDPTKLPND